MRRWLYILLGGFGAGLSGWAGFWLWMSPTVEPRFATTITICAWAGMLAGIALCAIGFVQGRRAGELDISAYTKSPRRDYGVADAEINFECPICHKGYRASATLSGKPFKCRECRESFNVPQASALSGGAAVQG